MLSSALALFLLLPLLSLAMLEEQLVTFTRTPGAIALRDTAILYDTADPIGVTIAVDSLADDWKQITGKMPAKIAVPVNATSVPGARKTAIIAATVDSSLIRSLERHRGLDVSDLRGKWEAFRTAVVMNPLPGVKEALVVTGSDKRGTMFGLYTLSEQCGQSPYHWWADVPATKHSEIYALAKVTTQGSPSVKYRGLFINDEAPALTGWWSKKHGVKHQPLDTEFYRHVFDLLVRLKANFLWPAMWASWVPRPGNIFFTDDPRNQQLADDYGIVVSTSHHEPMQRATNEWDADETGSWDWTVNKDNVTKFMEEGVRRAGTNESYFCLGMRGPNDGPIESDDPVSTLRDVFATEREILAKYHGDVSAVNQVWTIYKEVATYYAAGLIPPDDVTLMFTDDNWGNIMRLPTGDEAARSGGVGLYYHLEYVGTPKSYKWHNTNNLPKMYKELSQALERGADRIWVINVADIKPMELPFGFIMDLAWDASKFTSDSNSIPAYLRAFVLREFGTAHTDEIASILLEHSRLIGRRKYESTTTVTYSFYNYHEIERVLSEWDSLAARMNRVRGDISQELHAAFFHLVQYPIQAGCIYHRVVLGQAINAEYAIQRRNTANGVASQVLSDFEVDSDLTDEYNTMLDGKWDQMMDQAKYDQWRTNSWKSPGRDIVQNLSFVPLRQNFDYAFGNLGIYAEESSSAVNQARVCPSIDPSMPTEGGWAANLPVMDPYGPTNRIVDLFHRGDYRVPINWELEIPEDWIRVTPASGTLNQENPQQRLSVSIDWNSVPSDFDEIVAVNVRFDTLPNLDNFFIPIQNRPALLASFTGFPETAGYISIEAAHHQRTTASSTDINFTTFSHLGTRTNSGAIALRPYTTARASDTASDVTAEYDIYLFNSGKVGATVYLTQGLDTDPELPMMFSLGIDGVDVEFTRVLSQPETAGDLPEIWQKQVEDSVWTVTVDLGDVDEGMHTVKWRVNSPEVYLEKIVLDIGGGSVKDSYLGPPETMRV